MAGIGRNLHGSYQPVHKQLSSSIQACFPYCPVVNVQPQAQSQLFQDDHWQSCTQAPMMTVKLFLAIEAGVCELMHAPLLDISEARRAMQRLEMCLATFCSHGKIQPGYDCGLNFC